MEGNDRGLWITQQLGKSERGRDNQERTCIYLQQQVFRLDGREARRGRAQVIYTAHTPALSWRPFLFYSFCIVFLYFVFFRWFFVYCIVFLELLPSSDGVHARLWIRQVSLFLSRRLQQTLLLNLSTCQRHPVNNHTNSLINLRYYRGAGVCRVFSNTSRVHSEQQ